MKKVLEYLLAAALLGGTLTACSSEHGTESADASRTVPASTTTTEQSTESDPTTAAETTEEPVAFEEAVEAKSGDAFLAMVDGEWYVQYWGKKSDLLTYDAGVVPITKDGDYTVSVNGATKGMLFDVTGTAEGVYTPSGMSFLAVIVKDGKKLYPNLAIEIREVRVNGTPIALSDKKNYTSSDDGIEMRTNLFNEWVLELPDDAHDANGTITDKDAYTPQLVSKEQFGDWTSVAVDFTITGVSNGEE